jgi:hypothetical protein
MAALSETDLFCELNIGRVSPQVWLGRRHGDGVMEGPRAAGAHGYAAGFGAGRSAGPKAR